MDSMQSIDSTKSRQPLKEKKDTIVEPFVLSLFPSLDYTRVDVHEKTKVAMQTRLKVLFKTAEEGFTTKYKLTKSTAKPRLGGETAENALIELDKIQLLSVTENVSNTGSKRKDYSLTAKGLIVCLAFKKYEAYDEFSIIAKRLNIAENELAFTLLMHYRYSSIFKDTLKELVHRCLNFERLSEEDIVSEIHKVSDFVSQSSNNPVQQIAETLMDLSEPVLTKLSQNFIEICKDLKELSEIAPKEKTETIKLISGFLAGIYSWARSPETKLWMTSTQDDTELHVRLDKLKCRALNNEIDFTKVFDIMRVEMRDQLRHQSKAQNLL
jgi:hypothetical protein